MNHKILKCFSCSRIFNYTNYLLLLLKKSLEIIRYSVAITCPHTLDQIKYDSILHAIHCESCSFCVYTIKLFLS